MTASIAGSRPDVLPAPAWAVTRIPAGTTSRLVLLLASVAATSVVTFMWIYLSVPAKATHLGAVTQSCAAANLTQTADPAARPTDRIGQAARSSAAMSRCTRPVYVDMAAWVVAGLALQTGLAGMLYLIQPFWLIHRRRLELLEDDPDCADLVADLNTLPGRLGMPRSPTWLLDPAAGSTSGQAFGLPWRPHVSLDAGLVLRYDADPAGVRAVALHELAHLRHRDVGMTYLAIAVWRSFIVTSLIPFVVLLVHPKLLWSPIRWSWSQTTAHPGGSLYSVSAVLVLAAVVYLTRNAILRTRETHADAAALGVRVE